MIDTKTMIHAMELRVRIAKRNNQAFVDLPFEMVGNVIVLLKEQERKKGSWDYGTQCSVCKGTIIPPKDRKVRVNFCPWCGADMRGGYE